MRATSLLMCLGTVVVTSAWQCEPAFKGKFCPAAIGGGTEQCLTCAFEKFEAMKGLGCNKDIIQTTCNATNAEWKAVVAPYMETTNTDCDTHSGRCNACLQDESFYTHECYYCYQDNSCYGVGGSSSGEGCDDTVGNYACTSLSKFSGCHCPAHGNNQDDDDDETCNQKLCPPPGSANVECEFCEQIVGFLLDAPSGQDVCDGICDACCEDIPIVGALACEGVLEAVGGCDYIQKEISKYAGEGQCEVCKGIGACNACSSSSDDDDDNNNVRSARVPWGHKYDKFARRALARRFGNSSKWSKYATE